MIKFKITKCDVRDIDRRDRMERKRTTSRAFIFETDNPNAKPVVELFTGYRYNKPHLVWKKEVIPAVLKAMNAPVGTKVSWSQYAGCTCPCSPGFIIRDGGIPKNVFVEVETFESEPELVKA